MVTTIIAGIARPLRDFMMFGNPFTSRTFNTVSIKLIFQPLKTGFIVGKFMLKIFDSIVNHIQSISLTFTHYISGKYLLSRIIIFAIFIQTERHLFYATLAVKLLH